MRILSVALRNFKSHVDRCFYFEAGTNAICGENGAGKTSILEAIGWALFDFSDYTREEMVRAGSKDAEVAITFISSVDYRSYQVRRSTQRGYSLYDPQLNQKLEYELRADVLQWLRQHLGVPKGTDLAKLFASTIGVPQGMFTADFLLKPRDRKTIFDRILKVEEYQQVSKDLLKLENYSKEQINLLSHQVELLLVQLQDWDPLTEQKVQFTHQLQQHQAELARLHQQHQTLTTQIANLDQQAQTLSQLEQALAALQQEGSLWQVQGQDIEAALQQSALAQAQVQASKPGYEAYLAALQSLRQLEAQQQERQQLLKQRQDLQTQSQALQAEAIRRQEQLKQFDKKAQQLQDLQPHIEQQTHLEAHQQNLEKLAQIITQKQQSHQLLRAEWEAQNQQVMRWQQEVKKADLAQQQCQQWHPGYQAFQAADSQLQQLEGSLQQRQVLLKQREQLIQSFHALEIQQSRLLEQRQRLDQLSLDILALEPQRDQQQQLEQQHKQLQDHAQQFQLWHQQQDTAQEHYQQTQHRLQELEQQIQLRQQHQQEVSRIPEIEQQIQTLTTQLSRIDAAQQYQAELQQTLDKSHQALTQQGHQVQQALHLIDQLGRDFPQLQTQLHRIPPVLTQGSALTHQVIQALEGILTDISRQTSRTQLQTQRDQLQAELQTCYQLRAQGEQLPQLQQEYGSLQTQLANLSETLENLAWNLEGEQSISRQLQEIQAQIQKLGDPRAQIQLKQQDLAARERIEREWQALQAKMEAQTQPIQVLTEQLTATESLEQTIATLQSQRQQHRQDYDHYLQTLPIASALPEHRQHLQGAQNQLATIEAQGKHHQIELAELESQHGSLADLTQLIAKTKQELQQLGDPRHQASQLHQELSHRGEVEAALEQMGSQISHFQTQQEHLVLALEQTAQIDSLVIATQQQREQHQSAYETYLQFRELADKHPDYQQRLHQIQASIQENQNQTQALQIQRDPILASYDSLHHDALKAEAHQLDVAAAQAQTQMQALIPQIAQIEGKLTHLSTLRQDLATHQITQKEREKLHRFIKFSRDAYKQAGPKITALYQSSVNVIADRLFREIMDRPNLSLTWGSDYDIWVQEDGMTARRFISLSGGEQMAAALSVRLALLRVLGELDVAFFDEPTTNMDVQRRRRLAEAITQIKTFEQLVVISHDDTFEQVTENIIRVEREEGSHVA